MISATDAIFARLAACSIDGLISAAIAGFVSIALARRTPELRSAVWWLVCLKMLLALAGVGPIVLPVLPPASPGPIVAAAAAFTGSVTATGDPAAAGFAWRELAVAAWAGGALWALALLVARAVQMRGLIRRAEPAGTFITDALARASATAGRTSRPRLRLSGEVRSPQVAGIFRPTILLPADAARWPADRLEMVVCHELVHVLRCDLVLGWIPAIASRVLFFHPAAHIAAREYALAREQACDAEVVRRLGVAPDLYGGVLLAFGAGGGAPAAALGVSSTFLQLRRRLRMLQHSEKPVTSRVVRWSFLILAAALILVPVRLSARSPQAAGASTKESAVKDAYVLFHDASSVTMNGSPEDLARAQSLRDGKDEPMLWFRQDGREYVVRDPAVLHSASMDPARHALAADEKRRMIEAEMKAISKQAEEMSRQASDVDAERAAQKAAEAERLAVEGARERQLSPRLDALADAQRELQRAIEIQAMESERRIRELLEESIASGAAHPVM